MNEAETSAMNDRPNLVAGLLYALGLVVAAFALYKMSLLKPIDHDEHQFVASAAALARSGWLPYRDAPYHHLPYLSFLYAALFSFGGPLLATARAFCVAASIGVLAITGYAVADALRDRSPRLRITGVLVAAVVLLANPVFVYTSGRAWNHDLPLLLTLGAVLLHLRWLAGEHRPVQLFVAGVLLGAAIGTRSSFALVIPAFAVSFLVLGRADTQRRIQATALFAGGGFVALLPVAFLFASAPEGFLFGNLRYNLELNTEYRRVTHWPVAMDLGGKLDYVRTEILGHRRNGLLLLLYPLAVGSAAIRGGLRRHASAHAFHLLLLITLVFAAWSPTPTWYQYFFPIVPFLIIASAQALADHEQVRSAAVALTVAGLLAVTSIAGLRHYVPAMLTDTRETYLAEVGRTADELGAVSLPGPVLTLGPIFALEANRDIYPWLATGAFSWRTAPLVSPAERASLGLVGPDELSDALASTPPVAILVGVEQGDDEALEAALVDYARTHGYQARPLTGGLVAWVPAGGLSRP